jgi:hypothetical protein
MPTCVRLVHKTVLDGRYQVYTSPDVQGLHVTSETMAGAQREAIALLDIFARREGAERPVVAFIDPDSLQAAECGTT